jgi:hypothetical protein
VWAHSLSLRVSASVVVSLNDAKWPIKNLDVPSSKKQQQQRR